MSAVPEPTRRARARPIAAIALATSACVFPAGSSTGIEIAWRFTEQASDLARARTCEGVLITHVEVEVTDSEDSARSLTRRYPCDDGYAGTEPSSLSEAFFDVRPGTYDITLQAIAGDAMIGEAVRERVVLDHGIAVTPVELPTPVVRTALIFNSSQQLLDCQTVAARLRYEDPDRDLEAGSGGDTEAEAPPEVYGEDIAGRDGFRFNGEPLPCALLGLQDPMLDRGRYLLELSLGYEDGASRDCVVPLRIDPGAHDDDNDNDNGDGEEAVDDYLELPIDLDAACATDSLANPVPDR